MREQLAQEAELRVGSEDSLWRITGLRECRKAAKREKGKEGKGQTGVWEELDQDGGEEFSKMRGEEFS